jgi:uncharacterized membrane protein
MSDTSKPAGPSNVALIVSLCLNLLLIGIIATAMVRFAMHRELTIPPEPPGAMAGGMGRGQMHAMLSPRTLMHVAPGKADKIAAVIGAHHGRIDTLRAGSLAARQDVMRLFAAPQFDKAAFDKALLRMQQADAALETEILAIVAETATNLSPEERKAAAAAAGTGHGHGWGHGRGWRHGRNGNGPPPPGN